MPLLRGEQPAGWRRHVFSEYDYSMQDVRLKLNQPIEQCRLFMVFDGRWKYIHASGFRPMLYDLDSDPQEFSDRGDDPSCADVIARLQAALFDWALHPKSHITTSNEKIAGYADNQLQVKGGILIGIWDEAELAAIRERIRTSADRHPEVLAVFGEPRRMEASASGDPSRRRASARLLRMTADVWPAQFVIL